MRVSETTVDVAAARDVMFRDVFFADDDDRFDILVAVLGVKTLTGFVTRADTVVLIGVREVTERDVLVVVVDVFFVREVVFSLRTAAPASIMQKQ